MNISLWDDIKDIADDIGFERYTAIRTAVYEMIEKDGFIFCERDLFPYALPIYEAVCNLCVIRCIPRPPFVNWSLNFTLGYEVWRKFYFSDMDWDMCYVLIPDVAINSFSHFTSDGMIVNRDYFRRDKIPSALICKNQETALRHNKIDWDKFRCENLVVLDKDEERNMKLDISYKKLVDYLPISVEEETTTT